MALVLELTPSFAMRSCCIVTINSFIHSMMVVFLPACSMRFVCYAACVFRPVTYTRGHVVALRDCYPGLRPGMPRGPAVAAGLQTLHTKLPYITPSMTISSNK